MSSDPSEVAGTAADEISDRGWSSFIRDYGIGGIFLAVVYAIIEGVNAFGSTLLRPFRAFGEGLATLISGTFGAPVRVIDAGATATVTSFVDGASAALGPAAFPVAMGSALVGLWIFARWWDRVNLSPIGFLRRLR